ncbi:uncharacterized protein V1510DRAFT_413261 [Dipodascopsis tothii]|uniref:uncharacterized protein n=1 Tax=Dipodascopsis tothii TaxID=44089 RepID=UPI0034CD170D
MSRDPITCHVLNTVTGKPAAGIACTILRQAGADFAPVGTATTNGDGRVVTWETGAVPFAAAAAAVSGSTLFKVRFSEIDTYFGGDTFFPYVDVVFTVPEGKLGVEHFHIPLLLSRYSYSTYRGS